MVTARGSGGVPGHRTKWSLEEMLEGLVEDGGLMRVEHWGPLGKGLFNGPRPLILRPRQADRRQVLLGKESLSLRPSPQGTHPEGMWLNQILNSRSELDSEPSE